MPYRKLAMLVAACLCLGGAIALAATVMSVQVRDAQVRDNPSFLGKIVGKASYGQKVDVLEQNGDWAKVSLPGAAGGWMHRSALTESRLALSGGSGASGDVSGKEMALAGKGFNAQVEADYRRSHGGDYAAIDHMVAVSYDSGRLLAFLRQGEVTPRGGAK